MSHLGQSRHFGSRLLVPARPLFPESDHFIAEQQNDASVPMLIMSNETREGRSQSSRHYHGGFSK